MNKDIFYLLLPIHILALILLSISNFNLLLFFIGWFTIGCIGLEIGLHRYFSHKSFKLTKFLENVLATISIFAAQGGPLWWSSSHSHHHKFTDTDKDIHSPVQGKFFSFIGWYFKSNNVKIKKSILLKNQYLKYIHKNHIKIYWTTIIPCTLFLPEITLNLFLLPAIISFWGVNLVNLLCHYDFFGYRNYNTNDNSRNINWLSFLTWGLALHNNHHRNPNCYNFRNKSKEIDISGFIIKKIFLRYMEN